jgi:hypothetical protein
MKTKLLILTIALFIFFFKTNFLAYADYYCSYYNIDDPSISGSYGPVCSNNSGYDPGTDIETTCTGSPCAVSTTAPPPPSGGTCVNEHGYYSGSAGTFPCCSGLTPCSSTGTCETSCGGGTCVNEHGFYSGSAGTFPCCSGLTPCASSGTCETSCPGQICSPGTFQYVCTATHC